MRFLEDLRSAFPKLEIQSVSTLTEGLAVIRADPPPDLITLDLGLPDSNSENTLYYLPEIAKRCAVVIVTGKNVDGHAAMFKSLNVEVVKKGQSWMAESRLLKTCVSALARRTEQAPTLASDSKMQLRLAKMRSILEQLCPPLPDGQGTA